MPMPTTKEGLQRLLDFFVYGMLRAAESLGNAPLFLRTVEEEGLRKFLLINFPKFQASEDPKEACEAYTKSIDEGGLFARTDTTFTGDADTVHAEIGDLCAYRRVCTRRHDDLHPMRSSTRPRASGTRNACTSPWSRRDRASRPRWPRWGSTWRPSAPMCTSSTSARSRKRWARAHRNRGWNSSGGR